MKAYNKKKKPKHKTKTVYRKYWGKYYYISRITKTVSWDGQVFKDVGRKSLF
ncbi:MAG: hypothetical protein ACRCX2_33225 [Paraclostridium sp.]